MQVLQAQQQALGATVRQTVRLIRQLGLGAEGADVSNLQEILATDPEIYPEARVTGYFGSLTQGAVRRFQKKFGLEQAGRVGPQTLNKLNSILADAGVQGTNSTSTTTATSTTATSGSASGLLRNITVGNPSGKIPPGLLIAPGIRAKYGIIVPLHGQTLPGGIAKKLGATTTPPVTDTTAPIISSIVATSTNATSSVINWSTNEASNRKVWYGTATPLVISTSTSMVSSASLLTSHSLTLSSLTASTTYYYVVGSIDAAGNSATSNEKSLTPLP